MRTHHTTQSIAVHVAQRAEVSIMSVSRFFRSPEALAEKTRKRIEQAVKELNYVPNSMAKNLRKSRSDICALIVPSMTNLVFADVISELSIALQNAGYQLAIHTTGYDQENEVASLNTILGFRPAAVILSGLEHHPQVTNQLQTLAVPIVEIMDLEFAPLKHGVGYDQKLAQTALMNHLWDKGRRKFCFIGSNLHRDIRAMKRLTAARSFLADRESEFVYELTSTQGSSPTIGANLIKQMNGNLGSVDAIVCSNDDIAVGVLSQLRENGVKIPEDISVVGFNNLPFSGYLEPSLTTIDTRRRKIGQQTAQLLLDLFDGRTLNDTTIDTGFELILRDST